MSYFAIWSSRATVATPETVPLTKIHYAYTAGPPFLFHFRAWTPMRPDGLELLWA